MRSVQENRVCLAWLVVGSSCYLLLQKQRRSQIPFRWQGTMKASFSKENSDWIFRNMFTPETASPFEQAQRSYGISISWLCISWLCRAQPWVTHFNCESGLLWAGGWTRWPVEVTNSTNYSIKLQRKKPQHFKCKGKVNFMHPWSKPKKFRTFFHIKVKWKFLILIFHLKFVT